MDLAAANNINAKEIQNQFLASLDSNDYGNDNAADNSELASI